MKVEITRRRLLLGTAMAASAGALWPAGSAFAQDEATSLTGAHHALLVAVTDYPNLHPRNNLVGPNNDAELVREFLINNAPVRFAPDNVTVLADGIEAAGEPTHARIREEMAALAARVTRGDFVYLQFSGHGSQQDTDPSTIDPSDPTSFETDGLDEIFLPKDITPQVEGVPGVPNAYVDKEIREDLQAIRDKGAFIWAVFDCCHSGTMTRNVAMMDDGEADRKVDPAELGVTGAAAAATRGMGGASETTRQPPMMVASDPTGAESLVPGGMVAFFAAQTDEPTPEMPLPRGAEDAKRLGLFTYTILSQIGENPAFSYRQLGQAVLQSYSAGNRKAPTPLFEGDLDRQVFGATNIDPVAQWPLKVGPGGVEIPAGLLHRLSEGAKLAVMPSPASPIEDARGYLEVASATNLSSKLIPLRPTEETQATAMKPIMPADIQPGDYARLAEVAIQFELVVARPATSDDYADEIAMVNAILDGIVDNQEVAVNLRFVGPDEPADLKIAVMSEMDVGIMVADQRADEEAAVAARASMSTEPRIWLLSATSELSLDVGKRPPSLAIGPTATEASLSEALSENLVSIFRATNISRLSSASDFASEEVDVRFNILRASDGSLEPLSPETVPFLHPDDQVHIHARNDFSQAVDINVLYIGSDYSISHMYVERLRPGSEVDIPLLAITDSSFGMERMMVVLTEGRAGTIVEDLSFLAQPAVRQMTRSAAGGGFGELLQDIASAPATRSAVRIGQDSPKKGAVMFFGMETAPRA